MLAAMKEDQANPTIGTQKIELAIPAVAPQKEGKIVKEEKMPPYRKASRQSQAADSQIQVAGRTIGGRSLAMIAGPCAVESREQLLEIAAAVRQAGAGFLRGGAFKPRTSPYSFQGMGEEGLQILMEAKALTGLPVVTEVMAPGQVDLFLKHDVDVLQIGSRNMQNFDLLKEVGRTRKPVLLKRGLSATIEEFLMSAEYVMAGGNDQVILCERGIRTFETYTRNTLDLSAVPIIKRLSHLPIIIDPSHAGGYWRLVKPMALAALAAGADGLMVEVHQDPAQAVSDGRQSLRPEKFAEMMADLKKVAEAVGREL